MWRNSSLGTLTCDYLSRGSALTAGGHLRGSAQSGSLKLITLTKFTKLTDIVHGENVLQAVHSKTCVIDPSSV